MKFRIIKKYKNEVLDLYKKEGFEVIKSGSYGKGHTEIQIKRDLEKQKEKYNI